MTKKEFDEVLKETFGDVEEAIEKDLNRDNIFIADDGSRSEKIKAIKENREQRQDLSSVKRNILNTIDSLTDDKVDLEKESTKIKIRINNLEKENTGLFTIYEGRVGADFGTMAMALMLEYNPTQYNKLKVGERYSVSRLRKGVDKKYALDLLKKINDAKKLLDDIENDLSEINHKIIELDAKRHSIDIRINSLDIDYKLLSCNNRFNYIGISDFDSDIYIDPVDFGQTLKECFGVNGRGFLKGTKIC